MTARDAPRRAPELGRWIATVLRAGTLASIGVTVIGYAAAAIAGDAPERAQPLGDALAAGGGHAVMAAGLLALTLVPATMLVVAAGSFARSSERRMLATTLAVIALLAVSVIGSQLIGGGAI